MDFLRSILLFLKKNSLYLQPKRENGNMNQTKIFSTSLNEYVDSPAITSDGAIILCRKGHARIQVNFNHWDLAEGEVITIFPGEGIQLHDATPDFSVDVLQYGTTMLREASLQVEHAVYSFLRADRKCSDTEIVKNVVGSMFTSISFYLSNPIYKETDQIVLLLLKSFFMGFYEYMRNNPQKQIDELGSQRTNELFNAFMATLEKDFRQSRDVNYYASQLCITRKYLGMIIFRKTGITAKHIIDEYVIMQLKLNLRTSQASIKQIAAEYNFSDASFFIRYFRHATGTTPAEFRRLHKV